jgi:RHS repeat-associated protein
MKGSMASTNATPTNSSVGPTTYVQKLTRTDYMAGGYQYKDEVIEFIPHAEGFIKNDKGSYVYYFNYTDHLGNVRVTYTDDGSGTPYVVEESNYYPFGLKHKGYNEPEQNMKDWGNILTMESSLNHKYKYNGKEFQDELGLNMYDYGARLYDPARAGWMNIDPLAEQYRRWSPYNYCVDNPMRFIDPDGMGVDDVIINGKFKQEAFDQLKASSPNLNMTMNDDGKVTATAVEGKSLTEAESTLLNATTDQKITVNLNTTDKTIIKTSSGLGSLEGRPEAFGGSTVNADGTVTATQTINTELAEITDRVSGQQTGTVAQHAVIEAYVGAQDSPGAGDSRDSRAEYDSAHNKTIGIQERSGVKINPAGAMVTPILPRTTPDKQGYEITNRKGQTEPRS